ncbi:MAG: hybrid sensor histidine kinase/response regulator, partial [Pseudomonadota bacterium]
MSLVDSTEPAQIQVQKQAKIIEALMRRIGRQPEMDVSAYSAFQSAIELQKKIEAQSRDLARATSELESARYERERSRQNLVEALSSMAEGLAVFFDGKLEICNELFRRLLPDITEQIVPGLPINSYFDRMYDSSQLVSCDGKPRSDGARDWIGHGGPSAESLVLELTHDRWYQLSIQR